MGLGHSHHHSLTGDTKEALSTLWIALALNVIVCAAKLIYGLMTSTLSMVADGVHSLADSGASVIGLVSVYLGSKPQDDNHHYGHQKFETLAAFGISGLIGITAWEVFQHAFERLYSGVHAEYHYSGILIMLVTMGINLSLAQYERRKAKKLKSAVLEADAHHTASDFWVSMSVLVSLISIKFGYWVVDAVISLAIAVYLAYVAFTLIKDTGLVLSDAAFLDTDKIKNIAENTDGIKDCHHVRTRGKSGSAFVDLHIQVDPEMTTKDSHSVAHDLEDKIKEEITGIHDIIIHTEPFEKNHKD